MSQLRKFSRKSDNRDHLYRNLATSLVLYEKIETTEAKCKELKAIIDTLIVTAKKNNLCARRSIKSYLFDTNATNKMFEVLIPRFININSGFSRITRLSYRKGDGSLNCVIELVKPTDKISVKLKDRNEGASQN